MFPLVPLSLTLTLLVASTSTLANPINEKRQANVYAGAPISNITVTADNLVQCAQTYIHWSGAVVRYTSRLPSPLARFTDGSQWVICLFVQPPVTLQIATGGLYLPTERLETHEGLYDDGYSWTVTKPEGTGMYFMVSWDWTVLWGRETGRGVLA